MHYLSLQSWQPLGKGLLSVLVLLGLMLASRLSPPVLLDGVNLLVPVHIGLETLSIIVSVLIFSVSWSAGRQLRAHFMVLMGVLFLGVALLDFSHMLSFQGMPSPWPMMDGNLTIYFWLAARLLAALGLLLVALLPWRQSVRRVGAYAYLLGLLFLVACLHLVFIQFPGVLPAVFIPGEGLTFFKIATEYLIIVLHLATVALLLLSKEETHLFSVPHLVLALFIMIMSELFFTFYADLTDVYMLLGHLYKVIAYGLLYVVFVSRGIDAPYRALGEMKTRLQATVDALPDMMFELDREGLVVNFHSGYGRLLKDPGKFIGRRLADTVPEEVWEQGEQALADIDRQGYTEGRQYVLDMEDGEHWFEISGRYMPLNHELPHYLLLIRDITRRVHYQKELEKSQQFIQAALDHLPVGVALNTVGEEVRFRYMNERFASSFGTTRHVLETSEDF